MLKFWGMSVGSSWDYVSCSVAWCHSWVQWWHDLHFGQIMIHYTATWIFLFCDLGTKWFWNHFVWYGFVILLQLLGSFLMARIYSGIKMFCVWLSYLGSLHHFIFPSICPTKPMLCGVLYADPAFLCYLWWDLEPYDTIQISRSRILWLMQYEFPGRLSWLQSLEQNYCWCPVISYGEWRGHCQPFR